MLERFNKVFIYEDEGDAGVSNSSGSDMKLDGSTRIAPELQLQHFDSESKYDDQHSCRCRG